MAAPSPTDEPFIASKGDAEPPPLAIRPPVFDNPTTRALFDERTGGFWSVDTFASNMAALLSDAAGHRGDAFRQGQLLGGGLVAAGHPWLDEAKFCAHVQKVQDLPITVIAGCHTPAIRGSLIEEAFGLLRQLPTIEPWPEFNQQDLEGWMAAMASP